MKNQLKYKDGGFEVVRNLLSLSELKNLVEFYDEVFTSKEAYDNGDLYDMAGNEHGNNMKRWKVPQLMHPDRYCPTLKETDLFKDASEFASDYFGEKATVTFAHAINKNPHCTAETPWHQDAAFWRPELKYNSVSIWIPLQDVDTHNGCMRYIEGSHKYDVLPHQSVNNNINAQGFELASDLQPKFLQNVTPVPLSVGEAVAHCPYILHSAGANQSSDFRRALIIDASIAHENRQRKCHFEWVEKRRTRRSEILESMNVHWTGEPA